MKIAITASGPDINSPMDEHLGRAPFLLIYDLDTDQTVVIDNQNQTAAASGAGVQTVGVIAGSGACAVVTGQVGPKALQALRAAGIKAFLSDACTVTQALAKYKRGDLPEMANP